MLAHSQKIKYFLIYSLLIFSSRGNDISQNIFIGSGIYLILFIHHWATLKSFYKEIFLVNTFLILLFFLQSIWSNSVHFLFILRNLFIVNYGLLVLIILNINFIHYYEKAIYHFAIISLFLFPIEVIRFDLVFNIISALQNILGITTTLSNSTLYSNIFVYTCRTPEIVRNCGFMWEPGPFGNLLAIAILFNIIINKLKYNKRLLIMVIALITTFSTTSYIALMIVLLFYIINQNHKKIILLIPIFVIIMIWVIQIDFIGNKIITLASEPFFKYKETLQFGAKNANQTLGRFAGLIYNYDIFIQNPLFGIGGNTDLLTFNRSYYFFSTNGLGTFIMTNGIMGIFALLIMYKKSFLAFTRSYNLKFSIILSLLILITSFSFVHLETPLYFSFLFLHFVYNNDTN